MKAYGPARMWLIGGIDENVLCLECMRARWEKKNKEKSGKRFQNADPCKPYSGART